MLMKLTILSLLINMLSTHQADCFQVMEERHHTINFIVVHFFHDAATGLIWAENQVFLGAGETLMAKERFEQ